MTEQPRAFAAITRCLDDGVVKKGMPRRLRP